MDLSFYPTLDPAETLRRLDRLLVPGSLLDAPLEERIDRLSRAFRRFASCYPLPLWAPGLVLDHEMRGLTEALFPMAQLKPVFDLLFRRGCRFSPYLAGTPLHGAASWPDLLSRLHPFPSQADPGALLRELAGDGEKRRRFLFSLFLPRHYGAAFDRYPLQSRWLSGWLGNNFSRLDGRIRALDSACGSGEGTYGVAELIRAAGFGGEGSAVDGSTREPIELFAAAHLFFPHDPEREREYRCKVAPLLGSTDAPVMEFYLDEVGKPGGRERYDLVLCNGLLGGPLLHEPGELARAIGGLASRLAPGGLLLAADRFHAGWRLRVPVKTLAAALREHGLTPLEVPEGLAAKNR